MVRGWNEHWRKLAAGWSWTRSRFANGASFTSQVSWTAIANLGMTATGMLTGLLAARLLGPTGRGELAAIQSWVFLIGSLATLGMAEAVIYFACRVPERAGIYLLSAYAMVLLAGVPFAAAGWWLMPWFLGAQNAAVIGVARIFLLVMIPLFGVFLFYETLRAIGLWREWNLLRLLPNVVWMAILVAAFWVHDWANAVWLSLLYPVIFLFQMVPTFWIVWKRVAPPWKIDPTVFRPLLGMGVPTMLSVLPRTLNLRLDQMLMAGLLDPATLGLYVAAVAWSGASTGLFTAVGQVLFPRLSGTLDPARQRHILGRVLGVTLGIDGLITLALLAITPWGIPLLFGDRFAPAVPIAMVLVIANGFVNWNSALAGGLQGLGRPKTVLWAELAGLTITAVLLFLLLPRLGGMGAALASVCAYISVTLVMAFSLWLTYRKAAETIVGSGPQGAGGI